MNTRTLLLLPVLVSVVIYGLAGCAVSGNKTVVGGPAVKTGNQQTTARDDRKLPTTVAILPFTNETDHEFAYEVVRRTMANHFATKNYRWLHWKDVDSRLGLAGYDDPMIMNMDPAELANTLGVDGLIYGNITHYDKVFGGIYSQIAVGVELTFLNSDGTVIWEVNDVRRSHAGGVSTTPVGLLMNALVAGKHIVGDINLYRAADDLGRDLAKEIPEPEQLSGRAKPAIARVVHSGVGKYLKYGDTLEVGLEGDPGLTAAVVVEGIGVIDLEETEPGQYVGSVSVPRDLDLDGVVVTGRLQDDFGQAASWISPYGLLNVDNTPPDPISGVTTVSRDGAVALTWAPQENVSGYQVALAQSQTGEAGEPMQSANAEYTIPNLTNFDPVYIELTATDKAGNVSKPTRIRGIPAPDSRFGDAATLTGDLPAVITGVHKLTSSGNPYELRAPTRIDTGGVLLVGPGVEFAVSPNAKLSVLGELHMFGTPGNPVVAHDVSGQGFNEFLVLQTTAPVSLTGLSVEGGGIPVQIAAGAPLISKCTITDSDFNAISISGSARPVIRDCTISGARASGIIIQGQSQPTFENNRFLNNEPFHLQNGSNYQIDAGGNTFKPAASAVTVLGDVTY